MSLFEMFKLISALSENGVIGSNNGIPWKIPEDLRRFKQLTTNSVVVMGRKTYESLPIKPLPNRLNVVLTRQKDYLTSSEGVIVVNSLQQLLEPRWNEDLWVIGGEQVYKLFLENGLVNALYLTRVHHFFEGDARFPLPIELINKIFSGEDFDYWVKISETKVEKSESGLFYSYITYEKQNYSQPIL